MLGFLTKFRADFEKKIDKSLAPAPKPAVNENLVQIGARH
jgi:hypothetical protein